MQQTVSQYVIKQMVQWGVKRIYGVAGDAILPFLNELGRQAEILYIPCRHETAAALMASTEAKLTGQPTVCIATSGPGAAQLLNGMADAHMDCVPVIALTGQVETYKLGGFHKQFIDQQHLLSVVSARSELLTHPEAIGEAMHRAFLTATEQQNVAHLSVCQDLWELETTAAILPQQPVAPDVQADRASVMAAAERLLQAKKPLFLLGTGARKASQGVQQLAETMDAGIILTLGAKGAIDAAHPQMLGGLGDGGSTATLEAMAQADLLVVFGAAWYPREYLPSQLPIIQVDERLGSFHAYANLSPVVSRVEETLALWQPRLEQPQLHPDRAAWKQQMQTLHAHYLQEMDEWARPDENGLLRSEILISELAKRVKSDAIVTVDTGEHSIWFNRVFPASSQLPVFSGKWRTMGYGLPAAIAAKLTQPARQVIAIIGDGCLLMSSGELATLAEQKLAITVIVINNRTLGLEERKMIASGYRPFGTDVPNPNFVKLAEAFGLRAYQATTLHQLGPVLDEALAGDGPSLIDVRCQAPTFSKIMPEIFFQTQAVPSYNKK
ncbi:thiamine pyrophosphate-binding protein [Brevibacillus fluminis]|uniref:Thiamine pyrophosphate-binding protein n=1 Tax=Brevibacillus fluminis TaxID=511487 RepID=A0A3M8CTT3_9BACL|nr:thiamine pyrophosphate-binding protein [Brevibacillus fluminis]RNB79212.1 thiamine pyrophosphate-binding protein [Brevibacillus fluminis]